MDLGKNGGIDAVKVVPKPPAHSSKTMKNFWTWVHSIRHLSERERLILTKAGEAFDSSEQSRNRKQIKQDGMTINENGGRKNLNPGAVFDLGGSDLNRPFLQQRVNFKRVRSLRAARDIFCRAPPPLQ